MRGFQFSGIFLRQELVAQLVGDRYGSFDDLEAVWEDKANQLAAFPQPKGRSSIYRWLSEGVPVRGKQNRYKVLALCGLLDVDPLAVLDYERMGYFSNFAKLRQLIYMSDIVLDSIGPLFELYRPSTEWPSSKLARTYFGRDWHSEVFSNADKSAADQYALITANFSTDHSIFPKAVHIAYRRLRTLDTMWRYYGTVISIGKELRLYSESGAHRTMPAVNEREIRFRTYFGARAVEFKLVSLHHFEFDRRYPFDDPHTIGFEW